MFCLELQAQKSRSLGHLGLGGFGVSFDEYTEDTYSCF